VAIQRFQNKILSLLPTAELEAIQPHLEQVDLPKGFVLASADQEIAHVYFVECGLGSIVAVSPQGEKAEAGMFGIEGFAPTPPAVGSSRSYHYVAIQAAGHGYRIGIRAFSAMMPTCPVLADLMHRSIHNLATQVSYTALSNAVHHVDERLARWLLMSHDRIRQDEMFITHEYLALMLAVRRPSVTTALHVLEGNGFIRAERGCIWMRNRRALEEFARDAYGRPEAELAILFEPYQQAIAGLSGYRGEPHGH
jgi:CRP-like cAMP-binding protein